MKETCELAKSALFSAFDSSIWRFRAGVAGLARARGRLCQADGAVRAGRRWTPRRPREWRSVSSDVPEAVERLDLYLAASRIAHEAVSRLQQTLAARDRYDEHARELVREAARVALSELPDTLREARRLRALWEDQRLLDPEGATETLGALEAEMGRIQPRLAGVRERQNAIVRELRELALGAW